MKRKDQEPTPENIRVSIADDVAGRNDEIADFIKLLDQIDGPYSLLVDAPWGEGKTFFIKSVETILKVMNSALSAKDPKSSSADKDPSDKKSIMQPSSEQASSQINEADYSRVTKKLTGLKKTFLPFYFNAWENDFASDPLSALFASMAVEADKQSALKQWSISDSLTELTDTAFSAVHLPIRVAPLKRAIAGKDLVASFKAQRSLRQRIDEFVEKSIKRKGHPAADKIVIFIDELDRCRPEFAIRLLEQVKTLFQNDQIIVVYSADMEELSHAINGFYGSSFRAQRYLSRFFDRQYRLAHVDGLNFVSENRYIHPTDIYDQVVSDLQQLQALTIRDALRIGDVFDAGRSFANYHFDGSPLTRIARCVVIPLLIYINFDDEESFKRITKAHQYDLIYRYFEKCPHAIRAIKEAMIELDPTRKEDSISLAEKENVVKNLCVLIYSRDQFSASYREARSALNGMSFYNVDCRVYEDLNFSACTPEK